METLIKSALPIILNGGAGSISLLLILAIWLIIKVTNRMKAIEKKIESIGGKFKDELSDLRLYISTNYVKWETFEKERVALNELSNDISKIEGLLNGKTKS